MFKTLKQSFMLRCTMRTNMLIHAIRSLPLLNKVLHNDLYGTDVFKYLAFAFVVLFEIILTFLLNLAYIGLMIALPLLPLKSDWFSDSQLFLHIMLCLTVLGGLANNKLFVPNKTADYAISLLRMDARRYTVTNYIYYLGKTVLGMLPFTIIFGLLAKVPVWLCLLLPFSVAGCKIICSALSLKCCERFGFALDESKGSLISVPVCIVLFGAAYLLPIDERSLPAAVSAGLMLAMIPAGLLCWKKVASFRQYKEVMLRRIRYNEEQMDKAKKKTRNTQVMRLSTDASITSRRSGFEYFNELFIKRHRKMLWKTTEVIMLVAVCLLVLLVVLVIRKPLSRDPINEWIMRGLPFLTFVMYFLNRGLGFTQALFMNCDHSMLTYPFYKKPKAILKLFRIRLREIMKINAAPAAVIGFGLALLLWLTGGTDNPVNYAVVLISPIAISMFFSVHYLTIYYLLQPYTAGSEIKSPLYKFITGATYFGCYMLMQQKLPTFAFGVTCIAFCVIYCAVACFLVYKFAAKTFRLRKDS